MSPEELLYAIFGETPDADPACESCGRRGRAMVTATIGSEKFRLCTSCGDDARENGCEVAS